MPRKQWAAYEKVTAADVNANLSDQSVMRFANSTARSTAIPSPTEGMVSWLDDVNALQVYDGSAWVAVIGGTPGNPLGAGDPLNMGSITFTPSGTNGVWDQVTASMPVDAVIFSVSAIGQSGATGDWCEWGTGSAGSEVVRLAHARDAGAGGGLSVEVPWGMFVPAGTRVAFRRTRLSGTTSASYSPRSGIRYVQVTSGTQVEAGRSTPVSLPVSTAWTQIAATPPKAGGVWVTGVVGGYSTTFNVRLQLGLGGAGSEVAASGYVLSAGDIDMSVAINNIAATTNIQPIWWPASTRLAARYETTPGAADDVAIIWRETLS